MISNVCTGAESPGGSHGNVNTHCRNTRQPFKLQLYIHSNSFVSSIGTCVKLALSLWSIQSLYSSSSSSNSSSIAVSVAVALAVEVKVKVKGEVVTD